MSVFSIPVYYQDKEQFKAELKSEWYRLQGSHAIRVKTDEELPVQTITEISKIIEEITHEDIREIKNRGKVICPMEIKYQLIFRLDREPEGD